MNETYLEFSNQSYHFLQCLDVIFDQTREEIHLETAKQMDGQTYGQTDECHKQCVKHNAKMHCGFNDVTEF